MIGIPFQQVANQYNLKTAQGVAYGLIGGYAVTFLDGLACHRIMITTRFATPSQKDNLMDIINAQDLKGLYNVRKLQVAKKVIHIAFKGIPETMDKIPAFIDWFFPLLEQNGASKANLCIQCQEIIDDAEAKWVLRDGAVAFRMHETCAQELRESIKTDCATKEGSVKKGIAGAVLGALGGALVWATAQYINFYAPVAGIVIGWLAVFMYGKLGGKRSFARYPAVIASTLAGIALGVFLGELPDLLLLGAGWNALGVFFQAMEENYAFMSGIWSNLSMGMVFAGTGIYLSLRSDARKNTEYTVTDLD